MTDSPLFPPSIITSRRLVPNQFPADESPCPYRIAIIGEAPGETEEQCSVPFSGPSGQLLNSCLRDAGIDRNKVFVGNVCGVRPPQNDISRFEWTGEEIQSGLTQLRHDLDLFQPNICVLLGGTALHAAKTNEPRPKDPKNYPFKISEWSGSLFMGTSGSALHFRKCIPGFHPAGILRFWGTDGNFPRFKHALARAREEGSDPQLVLPVRELITSYDSSTICHIMDNWPSGQRCSLDIEGGLPNDCVNDGVRADSKKRRYIGWRCVALSARPTKAFAIAWWKFNPVEHVAILRAFARLMSRVDVPKVLQNSLYDAFVLEFGYGILLRNIVEDTMLKMWEQYCELPKSLSVGASIYTRQPHWKDEEMYETTGENLAQGCCMDVAVTLEICESLDSCVTGKQQEHYQNNIAMLNAARYMMHRGINYDQQSVLKKKNETILKLSDVARTLNELSGVELRGAKGSLSSQRLIDALYQLPPKPTKSGKLRKVGPFKISPYPPQYKTNFDGGLRTKTLTSDVDSNLALRKKFPGDKFLSAILEHRHLEGLLETLNISTDRDGRVRCAYNVVGTETGRFSCKTSPTGAGANLTTITKKLRGNYTADPDYDFFQCDLEGADGWTVAAHCLRLGDPTMFDDYKFGLKPAKIIALMYLWGDAVRELDRESIKFWTNGKPWKVILSLVGDWIYTGCKKIQHGTNYLMGIPTMMTLIMKDSFKESGVPVYIEHSVCTQLQNFYFSRYPGISLWHTWAESTLVSKGELISPSGQKRIFFGRRFGRDIKDTIKEFLAHEPQSTTTYSTNLAMLRLWRDPANRVAEVDKRRFRLTTCDGTTFYWSGTIQSLSRMVPGSLLIEPLHQVHDALCGQWPKFLREWARPKVRSYFDNELTIAGTKLTIPFDGTFGPSWGDMPLKL